VLIDDVGGTRLRKDEGGGTGHLILSTRSVWSMRGAEQGRAEVLVGVVLTKGTMWPPALVVGKGAGDNKKEKKAK